MSLLYKACYIGCFCLYFKLKIEISAKIKNKPYDIRYRKKISIFQFIVKHFKCQTSVDFDNHRVHMIYVVF